MLCKDLESVLGSHGIEPLSTEAHEHLRSCPSCQGFLADLETIVAVAKTIPAEAEPPARVWVSLRAQLEAEGLIKEDADVAEPQAAASWWESWRLLWKPRSLAGAAAVLALVFTAARLMRAPGHDAENHLTPAVAQPLQSASVSGAATPPAPVAPKPAPRETVVARDSSSGAVPSKVKDLAPSPSETASMAMPSAAGDEPDFSIPGLQPAAGDAPVDAALRQNLRTLNEFIAECELRLRQNPRDELAREYLNAAYQQKADLIAAMMESARSEH
jgi:hypothetical protein